MFKVNKLRIILILTILFSTVKAEIGEPNHKVPLFLSLVFPGGGQIYNGRYLKAGIYAVLEGVLVYSAVIQNERMNDAQDDLEYYKKIGNPAKIDEYSFYVESYESDRNNYIWMSVGVVLLSAGDAWVDSNFKTFKRDLFTKGDEVSLNPISNGIKIVYQW